jgi:hypothetical protein
VEIARPGDKRGTALRFSTDNPAGAHAEGAMISVTHSPFPFFRERPNQPRDFTPPGYRSLRCAVAQFGAAIFREAWTDKEQVARSEAQRKADEKAWVDDLLRASKLRSWETRRAAARGHPMAAPVPPEPKDLKRAAELREEIERSDKAEREAFGRWCRAFQDLRPYLFSGILPAEIFDSRSTGRRYAIPNEWWSTEQAWGFLESGRIEYQDQAGYQISGWVIVREQQLSDLLRPSPADGRTAQQIAINSNDPLPETAATTSPTEDAEIAIDNNQDQSSAGTKKKKKGRPPRSSAYARSDAAHVLQMHDLITTGRCASCAAAVREIFPDTYTEALCRRLQRLYGKTYP